MQLTFPLSPFLSPILGLMRTISGVVFSFIRMVPGGNSVIQGEQEKVLKQLDNFVNSDKTGLLGEMNVKLPKKGEDKGQLLKFVKDVWKKEWETVGSGKSHGGVYYGLKEHSNFLNEVYSTMSSSNALYPDLFPSVRKFEVELTSMACDMMGGDAETCGSWTSGGTESILMAMFTYREIGRKRGITRPEVVICDSAHPAFIKASHYFDIEIVFVPFNKTTFEMDVAKAKAAVTRRTIAMVGSAPSYPQGIVDPIEVLAPWCKKKDIYFHVDSCLGGFVVPFYKKLGYLKKNFDFTVPGVTSISCDVHKYGFANKGVSVVLYRNREIRRHQFYAYTEWPGGLYCSPAIAGARSGALLAQGWASVKAMGEDGYLKFCEGLYEYQKAIENGLRQIDGVKVLGNPDACVVSYDVDGMDVYQLAAALEEDGWEVTRQQRPKW